MHGVQRGQDVQLILRERELIEIAAAVDRHLCARVFRELSECREPQVDVLAGLDRPCLRLGPSREDETRDDREALKMGVSEVGRVLEPETKQSVKRDMRGPNQRVWPRLRKNDQDEWGDVRVHRVVDRRTSTNACFIRDYREIRCQKERGE